LLSVAWRNAGDGEAILRDGKGTSVASLSQKDPVVYFQPARPVTGLFAELPCGELEVPPIALSPQMAQVLALPGGSGIGIV